MTLSLALERKSSSDDRRGRRIITMPTFAKHNYKPSRNDFDAATPVVDGVDLYSGAKFRSITALVSPQQARNLRDKWAFDRQRNISQSNVRRLAGEMMAGNFTQGTQIYFAELPDGSLKILNGNHTLEAVEESGVPQLLTLTVAKVDNIDEAGKIYAVFDIHKARTWMDSLRGAGLEGTVPMASKVLAAINVIDNDFDQSGTKERGSRIERFKTLEDYREAVEMLAAVMHGAPAHATKLMKRAIVMGVALETIKHQPTSGIEFWGRLAKDSGLKDGDPERALLNWLRNNNSAGQAGRAETARACALAWNAYFKGKELSVCKPNQMGQFIILGTPVGRER